MNAKKFILAGIAGGATYFFLGWIFYSVLLVDFMQGNAGSAIGVAKPEIDFWAVIAGNLLLGFLLSYVFVFHTNLRSAGAAVVPAGIIGFFFGAGFDFIIYGTTNLYHFAAIVGDVISFTIISAFSGAIVAAVAGVIGQKT